MCYERHPESMRGLSGFELPAVTPFRGSADLVFLAGNPLENWCFNLPQHSPKSRRTIGYSHPRTLSKVELPILRWDPGSGIIGWLAWVICWLAGFIGWVAAAFAPARPPGLLAGRPRLFGKLLATSEEEIGHG